MVNIHPTAVVADDAVLGDGTTIGPYAVVGFDGPRRATEIGARAVVRSHAVIYRGTAIGFGFHAGHGALVREYSSIGDDVSVGSHTIIEHHVRIGDGVRIHGNAFIPEHSVLQSGCWIGPCVTVTNARYPNRPETKDRLEGVVIEQMAVVGASAVLMPGVRIGEGATVGAGAVVVRDALPGQTIVGNPGRPQ